MMPQSITLSDEEALFFHWMYLQCLQDEVRSTLPPEILARKPAICQAREMSPAVELEYALNILKQVVESGLTPNWDGSVCTFQRDRLNWWDWQCYLPGDLQATPPQSGVRAFDHRECSR